MWGTAGPSYGAVSLGVRPDRRARAPKNQVGRILIIAGPNGAGKTTFASEFLPNEARCPIFVNADAIAADLSPEAPERAAFEAGRIMVRHLRESAARGQDFAFETTLAGRRYARLIPEWRRQGCRVELFYLWLPNPELAIARVERRVRQGGHGIPAPVVRRRFERSRDNFARLYRDLVDLRAEYDASVTPACRLPESARSTQRKGTERPRAAHHRHPVLVGAEAAMKRAGERARRLAAETTGELVVFENGRVVCVPVPRTEHTEVRDAGDGEARRSASSDRRGPGAEDSPESR